MKRYALAISVLATATMALASGSAMLLAAQQPATDIAAADPAALTALGEALFFDPNLSLNRTQSCATCHDPDRGFADSRGLAASLGDDGTSLGDRNAPTAAYGALVPPLHRNEDGQWTGGLFLDGRAPTLEDQAGGPPLNPAEMGMPDKAAVAERLRENAAYRTAFPETFGEGVLDDPDAAYKALTQAIAAFERTDMFAPFDSRYDRFLRGEATLTGEEELGRVLFFSQQFTNCSQCHQLSRSQMDPKETFTDNRYHNIGVPDNSALRQANGVAAGTVDPGLAGNPLAEAAEERGKFRTPTLRNVAVTGPYMHNGVFGDLRTVVRFYNRYNSKAATAQLNPETGKAFGLPPVPDTLAVKELTHGPALDDRRVDALVAFLKTLTDARYEKLLGQ
ncbi:methylamine utilization protein MauG [Hoeflea sp. BAL378]|uniref:cytochrome-c peroxidase n=1 Tax=Hoeflea sp. BAL378 TaxID=1547437 RepID=UPI0005140504|nr:cytochrome c peroxidase [Hoeflea sp. BAL378]KGF69481.1 methylamine utilization protein MauG [Hoeflea sp. BAL378]